MSRILRCKKCGDIIQSKHTHDMVWCKCGAIAIDGGDSYCKLTGKLEDMEFLIPQSEIKKQEYITKKDFNLIVNDILCQVKPIKLRKEIASRLLEIFNNKEQQIADLDRALKLSVDTCLKLQSKIK